METKEIIHELRVRNGLSQEELAERIFVTRQAVSRWENGETVPNTETLKLLSKEFGISINTLLGSPHELYCQCCGMPLEDSVISREKDGTLNEEYCKWCYADGVHTYSDVEDVIDVSVPVLVKEGFSEEQARDYLREMLPGLNYWKNHKNSSDDSLFEELKKHLITEINEANIEGMPKLEKLYALVGRDVNLTYPLPNGTNVKFLDDQTTYLGNQLQSEEDPNKYFGVLGCSAFFMVSRYKREGVNPELVLYRKR